MATLNLSNLGRVLWLVARQSLPTALAVFSLLGAAYVVYLFDPEVKVRRPALDFVIVSEHERRAKTVPASDIAFVGDSSCSMGVDVPALQKATGFSAEAFCTAIPSGPVGHAEMIDFLLARKAEPKTLVIMLHPAQFARQVDWGKWFDSGAGSTEGFAPTVLDMLKFEWLSDVLFTPLPGGWGLYYGSEQGVTTALRHRKGSFIDPNRGLAFRSFSEMAAQPSSQAFPLQVFELSDVFLVTLDRLARSVRGLTNTKVLLLISPIPESALPPNGVELRREAAETIASKLGLTSSQIIATAPTYPDAYFSSVMHFNRWGREPFTTDLGRLLIETDTKD
jgi:hypothetical protein